MDFGLGKGQCNSSPPKTVQGSIFFISCDPLISKRASPGSASGKEPACKCRKHEEPLVWPLCREDPLEEEMATLPSVLAGETPWTEEPGSLWSMGSQRVRRKWKDWGCTHRIYLCLLGRKLLIQRGWDHLILGLFSDCLFPAGLFF